MQTSRFAPVILGFALLSACSKTDDKSLELAEKAADEAAINDGKVECALAGKTDFARVCETERTSGPAGQVLTIRHPDGGFRRFRVLTDGRGLAPAEGADPTSIKIRGSGEIELASGDDLYRLPAQLKETPKPAASPAAAPAKTPDQNTKDQVAG